MAKKKVCSECKLFVTADSCPNCKGNRFSTNWQGRLYVSNAENSVVAKKMGITAKGEYAIKVK